MSVARACPTPTTAPILQRLSPGGEARALIALVVPASQTDILARGLPARVEGTPHPTGRLRRRSADVARASQTDFLVPGPRVENPPIGQRRRADAGRACRTHLIVPARDRPASTSIQRKRWQGCIAPPTPLSGLTPGRIFTTSAATTITAPPNVGPICVSGTRSREAYAWRRTKSIPSRGKPVK